MGEVSDRERTVRRALNTSALAAVLASLLALGHHGCTGESTSSAEARAFIHRTGAAARAAGFELAAHGTEPRIAMIQREVPQGSCYLLVVAWAGRIVPNHEVRYGCSARGARIASRRPTWGEFTPEWLDPARAETRYEFYLGRIGRGFDPVAAVAAGIPLDPDEFARDVASMRAGILTLTDDLALARGTIPDDAAIVLPASEAAIAAIDAASDLRAGRGPLALRTMQGGHLPPSRDGALAVLHVSRRASASLARERGERRALAVVDPNALVRTGCFTVTLRFAGVGSPPRVAAHRVGTGREHVLPPSGTTASDALCHGDPVTIYSIDDVAAHDVILEASVGASARVPASGPDAAAAPASRDVVVSLLRGVEGPRDPWAALAALERLADGQATALERAELAAEAHMRLARDPQHRAQMTQLLRTACQSGSALSCVLEADVARSGFGAAADLPSARADFARACTLGDSPSCALATVPLADLAAREPSGPSSSSGPLP